MEAFTNRLKEDADALMQLPSVLLSTSGVADGAGFAALAAIQNQFRPGIVSTVATMPMGWLWVAIYDGVMMKATFYYGVTKHGA